MPVMRLSTFLLLAAVAFIVAFLLGCTTPDSVERVGAPVNHPVPAAPEQCRAQPDAAGCHSADTHG